MQHTHYLDLVSCVLEEKNSGSVFFGFARKPRLSLPFEKLATRNDPMRRSSDLLQIFKELQDAHADRKESLLLLMNHQLYLVRFVCAGVKAAVGLSTLPNGARSHFWWERDLTSVRANCRSAARFWTNSAPVGNCVHFGVRKHFLCHNNNNNNNMLAWVFANKHGKWFNVISEDQH